MSKTKSLLHAGNNIRLANSADIAPLKRISLRIDGNILMITYLPHPINDLFIKIDESVISVVVGTELLGEPFIDMTNVMHIESPSVDTTYYLNDYGCDKLSTARTVDCYNFTTLSSHYKETKGSRIRITVANDDMIRINAINGYSWQIALRQDNTETKYLTLVNICNDYNDDNLTLYRGYVNENKWIHNPELAQLMREHCLLYLFDCEAYSAVYEAEFYYSSENENEIYYDTLHHSGFDIDQSNIEFCRMLDAVQKQ